MSLGENEVGRAREERGRHFVHFWANAYRQWPLKPLIRLELAQLELLRPVGDS